jgi:hypothetical protein
MRNAAHVQQGNKGTLFTRVMIVLGKLSRYATPLLTTDLTFAARRGNTRLTREPARQEHPALSRDAKREVVHIID